MAFVPFDDRDGWIWMDGQFVPWREAKVHVLTHGLHYASAVFEGERMYDGEIFKLTEHTERLFDRPRCWTSRSRSAWRRSTRPEGHLREDGPDGLLCPRRRLARPRE